MTYGATLAKHLQSFQLPVETVAWVELARDRLHWRQSIQPGRFRDKAEEKEKERGEKRKKEEETIPLRGRHERGAEKNGKQIHSSLADVRTTTANSRT